MSIPDICVVIQQLLNSMKNNYFLRILQMRRSEYLTKCFAEVLLALAVVSDHSAPV